MAESSIRHHRPHRHPKFLKEHPDIVKNFLRAHVELTEWIDKNPAQAKQILNQQLQKETGKPSGAGSSR